MANTGLVRLAIFEPLSVQGSLCICVFFVYTDCTKKKLVFDAFETPDVDAYFFCVVQDRVSFGLGDLLRLEH